MRVIKKNIENGKGTIPPGAKKGTGSIQKNSKKNRGGKKRKKDTLFEEKELKRSTDSVDVVAKRKYGRRCREKKDTEKGQKRGKKNDPDARKKRRNGQKTSIADGDSLFACLEGKVRKSSWLKRGKSMFEKKRAEKKREGPDVRL